MLDSGLKITKLISSSKGLSPLGPCKISLRLLNQEKKNIHLCIVQYSFFYSLLLDVVSVKLIELLAFSNCFSL